MRVGVFPGQGSQVVGMGKEWFQNFSSAKQLFEEASDVLKIRMDKLCFEDPDKLLGETAWTQPALLTVSTVQFQIYSQETGWKPNHVMGHSLGEYSALVAAGAFSFSNAIRWVHERGKAMQSAVPLGKGSMVAVMGGTDEQVEKFCAQVLAKLKSEDPESSAVLEPANFNSPGQTVLSGTTDAIQISKEVAATFTDATLKCIPLSVSAPFHCSLMKPARDAMAKIFTQAPQTKTLSCSYSANATARITRETQSVFELLLRQIDQPVLWKQSVEILLDLYRKNTASEGWEILEFGPGKTLQGLIKRMLPEPQPGQSPIVLKGATL